MKYDKKEIKSHFFFPIFREGGFMFHLIGKNCPKPPGVGTVGSPLMEPALRLLQLGLQVPHRHLLLLQRSQILLWIWGLDTMILTTGHVPPGPPERAQVTCYFLPISFCVKS